MEEYFDIVTLDDIDEVVGDSYWLIDDLIPQNSMSILYGKPASGKTFISLDMCLHLAHSDNWKGKKINVKGIVIYCVGEGIKGVCNRIKNWHKYQKKKTDAPFILIPIETISFVDKTNIDKMIKTLDKIKEQYSLPISMIVVDTLSKASVGYDENMSKDMGEFLYQFDILKKYYDTSILFIHHSGKSYGGMRGSSYLLGTVDTVISVVNNNNYLKCEVEKQKDGILGNFTLQMCKYNNSLVIKEKELKYNQNKIRLEDISEISIDKFKELLDKGITLEVIVKDYKQDINYLNKLKNRLDLKK